MNILKKYAKFLSTIPLTLITVSGIVAFLIVATGPADSSYAITKEECEAQGGEWKAPSATGTYITGGFKCDTSKKERREEQQKRDSSGRGIQPKSAQECKEWGGTVSVNPSNNAYNRGGWTCKGDWKVPDKAKKDASKDEFSGIKDRFCKATGDENCDKTIDKKFDECLKEKGADAKQSDLYTCLGKKTNLTEEALKFATTGEKEISKKETPVCVVALAGWIVCPVMRFLGEISDSMYGFIERFLRYETLADANSSKAMRSVWSSFRNVANVLFVIAFLFIIMSQVSSIGMSNYGIKRMLPRLIVLSVIVNISFPLATLAVDISNIAGASLKGLIEGSIAGDRIEAIKFLDVVSKLLAGDFAIKAAAATAAVIGIAGLVIEGAFYGLIGVLVPVVLLIVVSLATTFIVLIARYSFITILVVAAPVALAAQLLPNTKSIFSKWQGLFTSLLVLYPLISMIFGFCKLAAYLIYSTNQDSTVMQLIAMGVQAIPLIIVPAIIKSGGGMARTLLGGAMSRATALGGSKISGYLAGRSSQFAQRKRTQAALRRQGFINNYLTPTKSNGRFARAGKNVLAHVVGGTRFRANKRSTMTKMAESRLKRANQQHHMANLLNNPHYADKLYGQGNSALKDIALNDAVQGMAKEEESTISAQQVLMRSQSNEELEALTGDETISDTKKVALLRELTARDSINGRSGALSYAQTLINYNSVHEFSPTLATGVTDFLNETSPGLVSGMTIAKINSPVSGSIARLSASSASPYNNSTQNQTVQTADNAASTVAKNVADRQEAAQQSDTTEQDEQGEQTQQLTEEQLQELLAKKVGQEVNLEEEIKAALASDAVSPEDIAKMHPEMFDYAVEHADPKALELLRDSAKVTIKDQRLNARLKNSQAIAKLADSGPAIENGRYKNWEANQVRKALQEVKRAVGPK